MLLKKVSKNANARTFVPGATAAACLALISGTANAQSNVTLYGIADVGIEHMNNAPAGGAQTREVSGNLSGSRWGLKGVEDLGGGMNAIFQLEGGFNVDDGTTTQSTKGLGTNAATTSRLFGRQSWVGLSSGGQQVALGRQRSLLYEQAIVFDPMGASTRYSARSVDYAAAARIDNAVKYTGTFGPLTAQAMYSNRYDVGYGSEAPDAQVTGRFYSGALTYATGPFAASGSFEQRNSNTDATSSATERRATVAATYVIGPVKGFAGYRYLRVSNAFLPANPIVAGKGAQASTANLYWAGAQYSLTPAFLLSASAYYHDLRSASASPWLAVLRADYSLSKRTDLYATAGFAHNDRGSALGVNGYGTVATGSNQAGLVVGIRQKF